jgi:N-formylglutamate amidohydrolase
MSPVFSAFTGDTPLLISVPHDGRELPADMLARMTEVGRSLPDTDWHDARLNEFATELGASMVVANYSRYVVDLNRAADDDVLYPGQIATGLFPQQTFAGEAIYRDDAFRHGERKERLKKYWAPYHQHIQTTLAALREKYGYALLWDAHSISSIVPRLFDGELPELNLGSNGGASCAKQLECAVAEAADDSPYSAVVNARFKGGYITRNYGDPENHIHALQLEIAQRTYMDEKTGTFDGQKAATLQDTLKKMLHAYNSAANLFIQHSSL